MEPEKIVEAFLKNNIQISPDVIDFLKNSDVQVDEIIKIIEQKGFKNFVINKKMLEEITKSGKSDIEVISKPKIQSQFITTNNYARYFQEKYEIIKNILMKKNEFKDLISINKINPKTKDFSIIVMVNDVSQKEDLIVVEDQTGKISLDISKIDYSFKKKVIPDEVVGLECQKEDYKTIVQNIIFPDIPLNRTIGKTHSNSSLLFLPTIPTNHIISVLQKIANELKKFDFEKIFVFYSGQNGVEVNKNLREVLDRAVFYQISNDNIPFFSLLSIEGLVYLYIIDGEIINKYHEFWSGEKPENIILNLLQKRDMNPIFEFDMKMYEKNPFILEEIPDIILSTFAGNPETLNYKGVTIIANGSFEEAICWAINLHTREVIEIKLKE